MQRGLESIDVWFIRCRQAHKTRSSYICTLYTVLVFVYTSSNKSHKKKKKKQWCTGCRQVEVIMITKPQILPRPKHIHIHNQRSNRTSTTAAEERLRERRVVEDTAVYACSRRSESIALCTDTHGIWGVPWSKVHPINQTMLTSQGMKYHMQQHRFLVQASPLPPLFCC